MADSTPYKVPAEPGRWRAIGMAAAVHAALFVLLWIGVRWQNEAPVATQAELWNPEQRDSTPEPEPVPPPKPAPVQPPKEIPKPPVVQPKEEPPVKKPDIALEQEKKRKALEEKKAADAKREREKREQAEREEREKRREAEQRKQAAEREKAEAERKKAEAEAERKKAEAEKRKQAEAKAKRLAAEKAAADKRHAEAMERLQEQAGSGATSTAAASQGGGRADADYASRVAAKIKSNTIFNVPPTLSGNPPAEYVIELLPDGSLRGLRKTRSSGVPGFDEAVARAIERSQPYPADKSGRVPSSFILSHEPKDQ